MTTQLNEDKIKAIGRLGKKFSDTTIFMHEAIAKKAGLSGTDHKYFGLISENGEMTAGELARITGLTSGAVTGLIDRLEKRKLVKRKFDKSDRRKIMIVPDRENAQKLLGPSFAALQDRIVGYFSKLDSRETMIIEAFLLETIQIMEDVTRKIRSDKAKAVK